MIAQIGETAGKIYHVLLSKEEVSISELPKLLKEKSVIVYQGLGWLAREQKISYRKKGGKILVSLTEWER